MEQKKARLGFIGCGCFASAILYPAVTNVEEIDLIAACDVKEELAKRNARKYGALRWYTDYEKMLKEEDLDGVIIVGPPQMHHEIGKVCLEAGKHIYVEKPPAVSAEKASVLAGIARENKKFGMVGFMKRFAISYQIAKRVVENEEFGPVTLVDAKFSNGPYPSGTETTIWGLETAGISYLIGQAVHMLYLVRYFGGAIKEIYANYHEIAPTVHGFTVNVVFKTGAIGLLNLNSFEKWDNFDERLCVSGNGNYVCVDKALYLQYYGSKKWIDVPGVRVVNLSQDWRSSGPVMDTRGALMGYEGELRHFAECIIEGKTPTPNLDDGVETLKIAEAIWNSARQKKIMVF